MRRLQPGQRAAAKSYIWGTTSTASRRVRRGGLEEDDPYVRRYARPREIHLVAHSRGTDLLASAVSDLGVEAYITQTTLASRFKIGNIVLIAPDLDIDVAPTKMWKTGSDPDLPYGKTPNTAGVFPSPEFHITVYVSPNDKALATSGWLLGSIARLGRIDVSTLPPEDVAHARLLGSFDVIQVTRDDVLHLPQLLRFRPTSQLGPDRAAALRVEAQRAWPTAGRSREAVLARADGPRFEHCAMRNRSIGGLPPCFPICLRWAPPVLDHERLLCANLAGDPRGLQLADSGCTWRDTDITRSANATPSAA